LLLILEIALALYLIIISDSIESSKAQSDDNDDIGWLNAQDYYTQFANFKEFNNYDSLFLILFFIIIAGDIIWKTTHRKKERRYFSSEVKDRY
jgi:hypothetical protein